MPHNENWSRSQAVFHHAPETYITLQSFQCADNWAAMCTCIILIQPMHLLRRVYWAWNMYHSVYFVFLIITFSRFIFIDSSILYSVFFKNCIVLHCIDTICICRGILGVKYVLHSLYYNLYSPSCNCSKGRLSAMQGILANLRLINLVIGLIIIIIILLVASIIRQRPHPQCHPNTKEHVVPIFVQEVLIRQWPLRGKSVWHSATRLMFF